MNFAKIANKSFTKLLSQGMRTSIFILFLCLQLNAQSDTENYKKNIATDKASGSLKNYDSKINARYKNMILSSFYLVMRDSTKIAVDLYLPKGLKREDKIPCLVHQTRYWRRPEVKFPFSIFTNGLIGRTAKMIKTFISNGYAIVNVDVRGSGASFGTIEHPWTEDEVFDGKEILDWIVKQPWSNGKTGSMGVSYGGTTAEFLASTQHPSLKAVVLMFSLFDVYEDNAFPGGVHNRWFTGNWAEANDLMDANKLPPNAEKYKWLIKGVAGVKNQKKLFKEAIKSHSNNKSVHEGAMTIDFRDEIPSKGAKVSVDKFSPHNFTDKINQSDLAVYSYSGWHDGAYQHAAIKRHLNLNNPQNKLILGPWEHGGAFNISPKVRAESGFDHASEILKFFDFHLKGIKNGLYDEPNVHYFTMGVEKWQSALSWPPKSTKEVLYINDGNKLEKELSKNNIEVKYKEKNQFGSGDLSRWTAVNGKVDKPYTYADWKKRTETLLHFSTDILSEDTEVSGHPTVTVFCSIDKPDGALIVYLEEVDSTGNIFHVTEGLLKLSHCKISEKGYYKKAVPVRTHCLIDKTTVIPGKIYELNFDMLPVSWQFKKGSKIRISISGGDKDIFEIINPDGYEIKIHSGKDYSSRIELPIVK
jgi:putative CocE/NonD family hydrolase